MGVFFAVGDIVYSEAGIDFGAYLGQPLGPEGSFLSQFGWKLLSAFSL